eukprot:6167222-Pyramimonas_sp.AAC.1
MKDAGPAPRGPPPGPTRQVFLWPDQPSLGELRSLPPPGGTHRIEDLSRGVSKSMGSPGG